MTWQGCTNPYLLRRGHRLPLYGVAEWEAGQPALEEDNFDFTLIGFTAALDALEAAGICSVFTNSEFDQLMESVRTELLPKLADVRLKVQKQP